MKAKEAVAKIKQKHKPKIAAARKEGGFANLVALNKMDENIIENLEWRKKHRWSNNSGNSRTADAEIDKAKKRIKERKKQIRIQKQRDSGTHMIYR